MTAQQDDRTPVSRERKIALMIPNTEREALFDVMSQAESDLKSAHAEICKLQGLDPAKYNWPEWSPQANSIRWFKAIRDKFSSASPPAQEEGWREIVERCATIADDKDASSVGLARKLTARAIASQIRALLPSPPRVAEPKGEK